MKRHHTWFTARGGYALLEVNRRIALTWWFCPSLVANKFWNLNSLLFLVLLLLNFESSNLNLPGFSGKIFFHHSFLNSGVLLVFYLASHCCIILFLLVLRDKDTYSQGVKSYCPPISIKLAIKLGEEEVTSQPPIIILGEEKLGIILMKVLLES